MARTNLVTGAFATTSDADRARSLLLAAGIPEKCIALSADLSADDVAAECPGQSYANQPGQTAGGEVAEGEADTAHVGACVLRVDLEPKMDRDSVELILRQCGAQRPFREH